MILAPRFAFLHLHKSGGTFVNEGLLSHLPGTRQVGYHLPRSRLPAGASALPVLGVVRNPWDYYVSWYSFQAARPRPNALFRIVSDEGREGFARCTRRLLTLGSDDALLSRVLEVLPADYGDPGLNLPACALAPIRGSGLGFYSFLHRHVHGPDLGSTMIVRMEELRTAMPEAIASTGTVIPASLREFFARAAPRNPSEHPPSREMYDPALQALVAQRDAALIAHHAYRFAS